MNTANSYTAPTPKQAKGLSAKVTEALALPHKDLAQYWIDQPVVLANRLRTLQYRPIRISVYKANDITGKIVANLANDGLAAYSSDEETELVMLNAGEPVQARRAGACNKWHHRHRFGNLGG